MAFMDGNNLATKVSEVGEFGLIERLREPSSVELGMGDDAAVARTKEGTTLILTKEMLVEGRHFTTEHFSAKQVGVKAIESTFSDLVAMGASKALYVLVGLAIPTSIEVDWIQSLYQGLRKTARLYGAEVVGGDTARAQAIHLSITAIGVADESNDTPWLTRSGAQAGNLLKVSGPLAAAAAGHFLLQAGIEGFERLKQKQREPKARWDLVGALKAYATAAIDLSDGLAGDLNHLCRESGKGARLFLSKLPIEDDVFQAARLLERDAEHLALHGGEDYELLYAVSPEHDEQTPGVAVGEVTADPTERLLIHPDGSFSTLNAAGFDHFA